MTALRSCWSALLPNQSHLSRSRWMRKRAQIAAALGLLIFGAACSDETSGPAGLCNGPVTVAATRVALSQLYFTWRPDCYANELIVLGTPTSQGAPARWWVRSTTGGFQSGVFYGSAPAGTTEYHTADPNPYEVGATVNVYDANGDWIGSGLLPAP
jgi:hypothetical protein